MKIIISSYDDIKNPFYAGGGAVAVHKIAERLVKNHQVTVLTGDYKGAKNEKIDGVNYKRIGMSFLGPKLGQVLFHLILPFYALLLKHDLWIESFTPPFSTSFTPVFTNKPVIALIHMLSAKDMTRKYKLPFHLVENFGIRFYQNFLVLSEKDKEKVLEIKRNANVKIVRNGVNMPKIKNNENKEHILFIGRIEIDQKGLDLLLNSFKGLVDKKDVNLVIAGSGERNQVNKVKNLIKKKGLQNNIKMTGRVEGRKKDSLFQKAFFVVAPSRYETFSLSSLEAISYGLPVVGFDIDGLYWLPESCGIKVNPFSEQEFADAMLNLVEDGRLRKRLGKNAREYSRNFNWDEVYESYLEFIEQVVAASYFETRKKDRGNKITKKIIKEKPVCYFISPHLDDAILSAGALMSLLVEQKVPVKVVNVFTKAGGKPYTLSAKAHLDQCGEKDAQTLYKKRRLEDRAVLKQLGIEPVNLGFVDALWRKKKSSIFEKFPIAEFQHRYPTYRFHIKKGRISSQDNDLKKNLKQKLKDIIDEDEAVVFCPKGIGKHVDHLIVRDACDEVFDNLIFWEDTPYCLSEKTNGQLNGKVLNSFAFTTGLNEKKSLIKGYKSQIKPELVEEHISEVGERYFYKNLNI